MKVLIFLLLSGTALAQFNPAPRAAYIFTGGVWSPLAGAGAQIGPPNPTPIALYVRSGGNWVAWDGAGGGGGGATIPSTTNLISGDGAGNGANSGIAPANVMTLSGAQTVTGVKTFSANMSNTSSTATTAAAATVTINDTEATSALMVPFSIVTPNMAAGSSTVNTYLGHDTATARNAFQTSFAYTASNSTANRVEMKFTGQSSNITTYASGNTQIGTNTDAGFKLDVAGTFRAQTSIISPSYLTANSFVGRSQTGALNQTIIASASTAMYEISLASNCKTAVAAAAYTATVNYTDTSNTAQSVSSGAIPCDTLGTASKFNSLTVANVLTGTSIALATTTSGAVSYDVAVAVKQVSAN
jgi:hypothetical protein